MNSHTAHFFNRVLSFMTIIALVLVMVPVWPQIVNAAISVSVFEEGFGDEADSSVITGWEEHEDATIAREGQVSGVDIASPEGGRFAKIAEDSVDGGPQDGYICREINAEAFMSLTLSYYWNGDADAEAGGPGGPDLGIVEARDNGNGDGNCGAQGGWDPLQSHDLTLDSESWNNQTAFDISDYAGSKFLIRFRNESSSDDEWFRVDGIEITGEELPTVSSCEITNSVVSADLSGWNLSETRATGHNDVTIDGLHIWTEGNTSTDKAAGYYTTDFPLKDLGNQTIDEALDYQADFGIEPGLQLVVDFDNNGSTDGILVGEKVYGNNWWLTNSSAQFVKDDAPHVGDGNGSDWFGTPDEWLSEFPTAQVKAIGYSLGSGVYGDGVIKSINLGCVEYTFEMPSSNEVIVVSGDTSAGENQPGWLFNRDIGTATPFEFNNTQAATGTGSLYVLPIGSNPSDKFIAENFINKPIADIESISYDFMIGAGGEVSDANHFYMSVYANFGVSDDNKFYDCRYSVVPATGSTGGFTTVTFDPTQSYPVATRTGGDPSPFTCPSVPADMDLSSPGSNLRVFAINVGDTSASDAGLDGYLDNVVTVVDQGADIHITTYDFEPEPTSNVTMCKFNQNEQLMSGWTLMLKGEHVEDLVVPANTAMGTTTATSLEAGKSYIAVATGVWLNDRNPDNHVDAEYSTEDNWLTHMDGFTGYGEDILDLQVAEDFVEWGSYNSNHTYATSFTPDADGTVNFRIFDGTGTDPIPSWYNDNSGSLNVSIYEGYAGVTSEGEENYGCVEFTGVPYGEGYEYEADEVMQAGWWHLDGQGVVSVNEDNENFSIFNTDEEPIDPGLVITNPVTDYEVLSESHTFEAEYIDADVSLDPVQWAIRAGTCTANTNTVAGNVDGFSTPFSWDGADFSTTIDMSAWSDGDYCLVVDPTEDGGENFRKSRWFTLENPVVVSCIAETNLLANASFEEPAIDGQWEHISDPVDWVVKRAGDTGTALMEIIRGYSGWLAADGEQFAELDSDESTRLIQTIPTIEDKEYTLSWAFSPRPGVSTGNNQMEVFIDGDEVASNQADGTENTNTDWETYSYSFVGDGSDVEVTFADATPSDGYGALLDNVSLTCNPDTGTINYCGDEEVNGYEQCELGDEGCNTSCQLANQCHEDKLVKITFDDTVEASGSWNGKVYLGDSNKIAPNGYWFSVDEIGEASAVSLASAGFKGLALDFDGAKMKFAWRGENPSGQIDYIKGNLAFQGFDDIVNDDVVREINGTGFKLENPGQGFVDVFQTTSTSSLVFDMRADTGNDGATLALRDGVMCEEDIPDAETYEVFGFVWRDENEDTVKNDDENYRAGVSISITNGTTTIATTTDAGGRYSFEVEAGSWTVTADIGSDWDYTYPDNSGHSHSVSVASSDTGPYDFGVAEDNSSSRNTGDNNGGDGDGNGGDGNGGDGGGDGVGGGNTTIDGTGATPQVAGASTGNFGSGEGDGDTSPDGKVLGESTSTDNDVDDSTEESASSSKAVAALVDWIDECWYWWLMVLTWVIASGAVYYWKGWGNETVSVMSVSFIFGILGLLGLIFYFVLGTGCALWPSLITTIGAALLYYINSLEVPPAKPVL